MDGKLHVDLGRGTVVELPAEETERRWKATTPQWPIMHAVLHGVTRDQMMARHKANHIQVVYAPSAELADKALAAKAAMLAGMGDGRPPVRRCIAAGQEGSSTEGNQTEDKPTALTSPFTAHQSRA